MRYIRTEVRTSVPVTYSVLPFASRAPWAPVHTYCAVCFFPLFHTQSQAEIDRVPGVLDR